MLIEFILVGVLGGLVRALYGLLKAVNNGIIVHRGYFIITFIISGLIGGLLGMVVDIDIKATGLAGYVGTDILENIFTGLMPKSILLNK